MDFVFMLTRSDQTVTDCLEVLDDIRALGLAHIGFKDVGVSPDVLAELVRQIKAAGSTSYMEVVSTSREACLRSARVAQLKVWGGCVQWRNAGLLAAINRSRARISSARRS